jgi:hypothetical protein
VSLYGTIGATDSSGATNPAAGTGAGTGGTGGTGTVSRPLSFPLLCALRKYFALSLCIFPSFEKTGRFSVSGEAESINLKNTPFGAKCCLAAYQGLLS